MHKTGICSAGNKLLQSCNSRWE